MLSALVGAIVVLATAWIVPWQVAVLTAWCGTAITFVALVWLRLAHFDAASTERHARREDESRAATHVLLVSASVVSLVAIADELTEASDRHGWTEALFVAVAMVTVAASWAVIHTLYALRYADQYYSEPTGGIDFPGERAPDYGDFAYVAFTVGMTFQVSDTSIAAGTIRRSVLAHALLSFVFGAFIVAMTINVVAGLFRN